MLKAGDRAPDFKLQNQDGEWKTLADLLKGGPILLAFYPGDFTPVCTRQLCGYQSAFEDFSGNGIRVVGISPDTVESHRRFREKYKLQFELLADPGKDAFREYGVISKLLFGRANRGVFIIDSNAKIAYERVEAVSLTHRKAPELLDAIRQLGLTPNA